MLRVSKCCVFVVRRQSFFTLNHKVSIQRHFMHRFTVVHCTLFNFSGKYNNRTLSLVILFQFTAEQRKLECGWMPNVMATQPNICGAIYETSVIPFLVPRHKVWLTAAARVPSSNAANIGECKTWTQSEFCMWQKSVRGKSHQKCIYSVRSQERRSNIVKSFVDCC